MTKHGKRPHGEVRQSQMLTSYGPGALTAAFRSGGHGVVRPPRVNENARNQPAFRDGRRYPRFSNPVPALPERCKGNAGYSAYSRPLKLRRILVAGRCEWIPLNES